MSNAEMVRRCTVLAVAGWFYWNGEFIAGSILWGALNVSRYR